MSTTYHFKKLPEKCRQTAGGKAGTLSKLYKSGYSVPEGFIILPSAFSNDDLTDQSWIEIQSHLAYMRKKYKDISFAVRSSALSEDSPQASFAGEFETVLDIKTDDEIREAISKVRKSRHNARVHSYNKALGLEENENEIAVIIQRLIRADYSGVLFTADPVTGDLMHMTGNFVKGLGDKLVSGQVNGEPFSFERPKGKYIGPQEIEGISHNLYKQVCRLEFDLGRNQDIEWAVSGKQLYILQSRPITTMQGYNPVTCECNESLTGNFLWTGTNDLEAGPGVRTPFSSTIEDCITNNEYSYDIVSLAGYTSHGLVGGRGYINMSVSVSAVCPLFGGDPRNAYRIFFSDAYGDLPDNLDIPLVPFSKATWLTKIFPGLLKMLTLPFRWKKKIPEYIAETPGWCKDMYMSIRHAKTGMELFELWQKHIESYNRYSTHIRLASAASSNIPGFERFLQKLVSAEDANALISNLSGLSSPLASLGPLIGLDKLIRGKMDRHEYVETYGHRCADDAEISYPRPSEDSEWLDRRITDFIESSVDVNALLEKQRMDYKAAWEKFCRQNPKKIKTIQRRLKNAAEGTYRREAVRTEQIRVWNVVRAFALRAGEITGLQNDIFFLTAQEVLAALKGEQISEKLITVRKETYERYKNFPPYPSIIVGRFDPFKWSEDPNRRSDIYIAGKAASSSSESDTNIIKGTACAFGVVEGIVRMIDDIEESDQFRKGEILLTRLANVGWTLLFPKASAIITDIGTPHTHASIVARELGIPTVVGCMNATMRLKTGDRVRVDGGAGTVTIL